MDEAVDLPFRLHGTGTPWVPPLRLERHLFLNRHYNAFFSKGDARLFLARRGGRVVGRMSAQYERRRLRSGGVAGPMALDEVGVERLEVASERARIEER